MSPRASRRALAVASVVALLMLIALPPLAIKLLLSTHRIAIQSRKAITQTHALAVQSRRGITQIYDIRVDNCRQQNARHNHTLAVLKVLYSHGHASSHSQQATELVINALVPVRDCSAIRRPF